MALSIRADGRQITNRSTNSWTGVASSRCASRARSRIARCCFGGKRRARLVRNFATSNGMPSCAAAAVADRVFDHDLVGRRAVLEEDLMRIGDRALLGVEVVAARTACPRRIHLRAQRVDARVGGDVVLVVGGGQPAVDQRHRDHVLDAVVAVGGIVQRALLVDDADRRLVGADHDLLDLVEAVLAPAGAAASRTRPRSGRGTPPGSEILNSTFSIT